MTIIKDLTFLNANYSKMTVDAYGNVYVNSATEIYKITPEGEMSLFVDGLSYIRGMDFLTVIYTY